MKKNKKNGKSDVTRVKSSASKTKKRVKKARRPNRPIEERYNFPAIFKRVLAKLPFHAVLSAIAYDSQLVAHPKDKKEKAKAKEMPAEAIKAYERKRDAFLACAAVFPTPRKVEVDQKTIDRVYWLSAMNDFHPKAVPFLSALIKEAKVRAKAKTKDSKTYRRALPLLEKAVSIANS